MYHDVFFPPLKREMILLRGPRLCILLLIQDREEQAVCQVTGNFTDIHYSPAVMR